jgi:UDP-2-acetamido-2,6-beta-L-arabino-hexul-4-ose reductase
LTIKRKRILVTGANGFIGKNLIFRLNEIGSYEVFTLERNDDLDSVRFYLDRIDAIVHLAGENRPLNEAALKIGNIDLTYLLCQLMKSSGRSIPFLFSSSSQATQNTPYGLSKLAAEKIIEKYSEETGSPACLYRLPGVFGKWSKPNYNSVVSTFCHNIAQGQEIKINNPETKIELVYIDDVINEFVRILNEGITGLNFIDIQPKYEITLGSLADQILFFRDSRKNLMTDRVGSGLIRALYSTYLSYLPKDKFVYDVPAYDDERGLFVEMLKTPDCGQFSFFTLHPGVTRGSHYHHSKTEKFLVVSGNVLMRFRNLIDGEICQVQASSKKPQIIDSIPGWIHDVTNIGSDDAVVILWANEVFNHEHPDCISCKV